MRDNPVLVWPWIQRSRTGSGVPVDAGKAAAYDIAGSSATANVAVEQRFPCVNETSDCGLAKLGARYGYKNSRIDKVKRSYA